VAGFSLLELVASLAILTLVLGSVFTFMVQSQKRFQGNTVISQSNQAARAALEMMSQEIGQAGFNPQFTSAITSSVSVTASATPQCVTLSSINGINAGDWVLVDTGAAFEQVQVLATSNGALSGQAKCPGGNQISGIFEQCHNNNVAPCPTGILGSFPIASWKFPYPSGILQGQTVSYGGSNISVSNDHILAVFYGDTDNSGNVWYVVYSLYNPTSSRPLQSVTIKNQTFNLYTLYRSITKVTFATGATVTQAYPMVQNVLYQSVSGSNPVGPSEVSGGTGQPIFTYRFTDPVTLVPSTVSVVGTIVINLSVAVNPQDLETGNTVQWYTLSSQIRPINLWSAVTINQTGGGRYLPPTPQGLPMSFPSSLASYYVN
jgi:type II secretory pathway pseudopilin PulG